MKLSALQKYILMECYNSKNSRLNRKNLTDFYTQRSKKPNKELRQKIITKSIERLIDKDLLIGYGGKTATKWYVLEIKLNTKGKREARNMLGEQLSIPLKRKKKKINK